MEGSDRVASKADGRVTVEDIEVAVANKIVIDTDKVMTRADGVVVV